MMSPSSIFNEYHDVYLKCNNLPLQEKLNNNALKAENAPSKTEIKYFQFMRRLVEVMQLVLGFHYSS